MHKRLLMRLVCVLAVGGVAGCGVLQIERTVFANQPTDPEGELLYFEDIDEITQDPTLLPDGMRNALRLLGIESEDLINAIVEDGLGATSPPVATDDGGGDGTGDETTDTGG